MEYCGQCGAQLANEHRFCPSCGALRSRLVQADAPEHRGRKRVRVRAVRPGQRTTPEESPQYAWLLRAEQQRQTYEQQIIAERQARQRAANKRAMRWSVRFLGIVGLLMLIAIIIGGLASTGVPPSSSSGSPSASNSTGAASAPTSTADASATESPSSYRSDFIQWASILASFIKYCQLATGEQLWTNTAMSLHDFMADQWQTPADVCNAEGENITYMTPPVSSADYLPATEVPPGGSNFNFSPRTPYARMSKARDELASWARHEAASAAASSCDFGQCNPPSQVTQDLLSRAEATIVAVGTQAGITLEPDTLQPPGAPPVPPASS